MIKAGGESPMLAVNELWVYIAYKGPWAANEGLDKKFKTKDV